MTRNSLAKALRSIGAVLFCVVANFTLSHAAEEKPAPAAPLRTATVDMRELYQKYFRSAELEKEMSVHRARIQKESNERLAHMRELENQLGKIRPQLEDPALNESKKQSLFKTWQSGQQELIAVDRERREFFQRRTQALNEKAVLQMKDILEEIRKIVEEQAKSDNFDCVFDRSGLSTTQVPFMLYAKDSTDMTSALLTRLNRDAPAGNPVTKTTGEGSIKVEAER